LASKPVTATLGTAKLIDGQTKRLSDLCKQADGEEYISGPAAKDYIVSEVFSDHGIKLTWFDYAG
jgi:hypothetical protein